MNNLKDLLIRKMEIWESENNKAFYEISEHEQDSLISLWELQIAEGFNRIPDRS